MAGRQSATAQGERDRRTAPVALSRLRHRIEHVEEGGVTAELTCRTVGCGAASGPLGDPGAAQLWALRHAARAGHRLFARRYEDHVYVARIE
ncbi:hypothetical protein MTQ01_07985 [Streptomyces sp. XM4193]|uniref:DUF7848 domain-containing protein n=1 Tax=Streptomyces sp. XM4193 TaxID=2929782 RepID=UPI001FF95CC4|nr:hypothetical protein [Streptomyces sp. XM4193]MCK1795942.1 hypothetical protein [Streptomyces sp. XM4193]